MAVVHQQPPPVKEDETNLEDVARAYLEIKERKEKDKDKDKSRGDRGSDRGGDRGDRHRSSRGSRKRSRSRERRSRSPRDRRRSSRERREREDKEKDDKPKKKHKFWDIPPVGYEHLTPKEYKELQAQGQIPRSTIQAAVPVVGPSVTCQSRRLYVGNIPFGCNEEAMLDFFNQQVPLSHPSPIFADAFVWLGASPGQSGAGLSDQSGQEFRVHRIPLDRRDHGGHGIRWHQLHGTAIENSQTTRLSTYEWRFRRLRRRHAG